MCSEVCFHGDPRSCYIDNRDLASVSDQGTSPCHTAYPWLRFKLNHLCLVLLLCQLRGAPLHSPGLPRPPTHPLTPQDCLTHPPTLPLTPQDCLAHPPTPILEAVNVGLLGVWTPLPKLAALGLTIEPLLASLINGSAEHAGLLLRSLWTPKHVLCGISFPTSSSHLPPQHQRPETLGAWTKLTH